MDFDLGDIQSSGGAGMDDFLASEPQKVATAARSKTAAVKTARVKIGSLQQLDGFQRISSDTLIHKSTQDLWALRKVGEEYLIERLFQDNGQPLKG
jgi:hypothetical protein